MTSPTFLTTLLLALSLMPATTRASEAGFDLLYRQIDEGVVSLATATETRSQLERLRAQIPSGDSARQRRFDALRCDTGVREDYDRVAIEAREGLKLAGAARDAESQARFHLCAGLATEYLGNPRDALPHYTAGVELARKHELLRVLGKGLSRRAAVSSQLGEQAQSLLDLLESRRVYQQAGLNDLAEANLLYIAMAYRRMGVFDKARDYLQQSEAYATRRGQWQMRFDALLQLGYLEYDRGEPTAAVVPFEQALALAESNQNSVYAGIAQTALAASKTASGDPTRGLQLLYRAEASLSDDSTRALWRLRRGEALAALDRHTPALGDFDAAQQLLRGENPRLLALILQARANSHRALKNTDAALADYQRLMTLREQLDRANRDQQEALLRHQLDADRREIEARRAAVEQELKQRQAALDDKARQWQLVALASTGLLLLVLLALWIRQILRARRREALAMTDPLTGVANRRSVEETARAAILLADRHGDPMTVFVFDIDHFKQINASHGAAVGDEVLRRIAIVCQQALRKFDRLGRIGGEEFVVVLPRTPLQAGLLVAQRLRENVEQLELDWLVPGLRVTVSIGVVQFRHAYDDFDTLLKRADAAMLRAKENGRNRVEIAG